MYQQNETNMNNKEMRKVIAKIMIENNTDMYELSASFTMKSGIDYVTLHGENDVEGINLEEEYIKIPNEYIKEIYDEVRKEFNAVHIWELSEKEVKQLENHIIWNSLYIGDYENKFGVNPKEVCDFADGYLEVEDEYESWYDYIQSVEIC